MVTRGKLALAIAACLLMLGTILAIGLIPDTSPF
jgi:hypothetical protein